MALPKAEQPDAVPVSGDVLVTSDGNRHLLSIVPHPHRMSFKELSAAKAIAMKWAKATGCDVWHHVNGVARRLPPD
jgi:hypothetical protein